MDIRTHTHTHTAIAMFRMLVDHKLYQTIMGRDTNLIDLHF